MNGKTVVYKGYKDAYGKIATRTLLPSQTLPKGCYWTKSEALAAYDKRQAEKLADRNKYKPIADAKLDKVENDIKQILKSNKCDLYFTYEGDSQGIDSESLELSIVINGHEYTKEMIID